MPAVSESVSQPLERKTTKSFLRKGKGLERFYKNPQRPPSRPLQRFEGKPKAVAPSTLQRKQKTQNSSLSSKSSPHLIQKLQLKPSVAKGLQSAELSPAHLCGNDQSCFNTELPGNNINQKKIDNLM